MVLEGVVKCVGRLLSPLRVFLLIGCLPLVFRRFTKPFAFSDPREAGVGSDKGFLNEREDYLKTVVSFEKVMSKRSGFDQLKSDDSEYQ